jgi:hypothetical protein
MIAGTISFVSMCQGLAPRLRATLNQRIHLGQAGRRGKRHRPERGKGDEKDDRPVPGREHQHRERHPGERADHAQELERRVAQIAESLAAPHENADRHTDGDGEKQPHPEAIAAGDNCMLQLAQFPKLREGLERREETEGGKIRRPRIGGEKMASNPPNREQDRQTPEKVEKPPRRRLGGAGIPALVHPRGEYVGHAGSGVIAHSSTTSTRA